MNPLTWFGGGLTGMAAALAIGVAMGGSAAWKVQNWRHDAQKAEQLAEAHRINNKRASVTDAIGTSAAAAEARVHTVTKTIIREVPTYVSANDCPLSPGFRVFHDAAAAGELPDAARIADAAAVPAPEIAATVADNYGSCLATAQRLTRLQDWIRGQQAVK